MKLNVNNKNIELDSEMSIEKFLLDYNHAPEKVVISINNTIVQPADYSKTLLHDGDRLELLAFVGGG